MHELHKKTPALSEFTQPAQYGEVIEEFVTHLTTSTLAKVLKIPCWCLQEIPELAGVPAFWVNSAACVDVARNKITHKLAHGELIETEPWLKDGPITIGKAPALM